MKINNVIRPTTLMPRVGELLSELDFHRQWSKEPNTNREVARVRTQNLRLPISSMIIVRYSKTSQQEAILPTFKIIGYQATDISQIRPEKSVFSFGIHPNSASLYLKQHILLPEEFSVIDIISSAIGWMDRPNYPCGD